MTQRNEETGSSKTFTEEFEISADKLIDRIKELAAEANTRRVRIKTAEGGIAVDIPITVGAVAGGAFVIAAPALALIGTLVAFFSRVKLEVVREVAETPNAPVEPVHEDA